MNLEGRDKLTKMLQFLAKFLAWQSNRRGHSDQTERYRFIAGKHAFTDFDRAIP